MKCIAVHCTLLASAYSLEQIKRFHIDLIASSKYKAIIIAYNAIDYMRVYHRRLNIVANSTFVSRPYAHCKTLNNPPKLNAFQV